MHGKRILSYFLSAFAVLLAVTADAAETAATNTAVNQNRSSVVTETNRPQSAVVTEGKINVRGKPSLVGEVVTQLERGEKVTILERIPTEGAKPGEPTNWVKIKLPENVPAWVFAPFIRDGKVAASRLNLRAGPGERFSVIGRLSRGDEVKAIRTVEEWIEIEAPEDAYAFIDSSLVRVEGTNALPGATLASELPAQPAAQTEQAHANASPPESSPAGTTNTTADSTPNVPEVAPLPEQPALPADTASNTDTNNTAEAVSPPDSKEDASAVSEKAETVVGSPQAEPTDVVPPSTDVAPPPVVSTPTPPIRETAPGAVPTVPTNGSNVTSESNPLVRKPAPTQRRIVRREGIIEVSKSIQAPTWFQLVHAQTGKTINYLYGNKLEEATSLKLKDLRGQRVAVSGEEAIDPRWPNTPILDLETLDVLP